MTARLPTLVRHDVRLQYRYGIYLAYAFVVAFYAAVLILSGPYLPVWVPALIIFTDPAALGFFFLGALMMLERTEGVRTALAVTPLTAGTYFSSKAVTLTALALAACAALLVCLHRATDPALMLLTVALTAVHFIGIGMPIALRFRTVSGYLIGSASFLAPVIAPGFVALLDPFPLWLAIIPAAGQLRLMLVATGGASATALEIGVMLGVSVLAAAGAVWLALHFLRQEFGK